MEQQSQKKAWVPPELIVLVRTKPEEAVLAACKGGNTKGAKTQDYTQCQKQPGTNPYCMAVGPS
jgi:hypothetical protein